MIVTTKNGSQYVFFVDTLSNQMRVKGGPFEVEFVVTDLKNLTIGERLEIEGYFLDPITHVPKYSFGKRSNITATIAKIQP
ncbi:MAG: hypothetical protein K6B70_03290 [Clostridia bacterium]|nr:hypothetical protein [Clostridia bacterium]